MSTSPRQLKIIELEISTFSKKGNGLGVCQKDHGIQWTVEVPFTLPGDRVKAQVMRKRNGIHHALLVEILTPSPNRVKPLCIHFGSCGGCRWQHLPYEKQLQEKEREVRQLIAPYLTAQTHFYPILACDPPWKYRNKMEFSFSSNKAQEKFLGLMMDSGRGKVINLEVCHLVNHWFMDALKAAKQWWEESDLLAYYPPKDTGSLRTLTVREGKLTGDRMVMLTVSGNPQFPVKEHHLEVFVKHLRTAIEPSDGKRQLSLFLRIHQAKKGMPTEFYEMLLHGPDHIREILTIEDTPYHFNVSPSAFFQPNTLQAEALYSLAVKMAQMPARGVVYDLYCGTGTLGICFAKKAAQVLGIELSPESSLDARTNAALNQLDNVTILTGDVGKVLETLKKEAKYPAPDLIVVDPPRSGLDEKALQHILELDTPAILSISCNPKTQADNLAVLTKHGYVVESVQPVDQFPHTVHIENIVYLVKKRA